MNLIEEDIIFNDQLFTLNNQHSMYWPNEKALIISDLHLGKTAYFRKNGFAVPDYTHKNDLKKLAQLLEHYQPEKLIIVGDLIHARNNNEVIDFINFKNRYANTQFILIKGNHDVLSDKFIQSIGIDDVHQSLNIGTILFIHEPELTYDFFTISGHKHPGVFIKLLKNKGKRLPCFVVSKNQLILPAFSEFTGLDTNNNVTNATFYAFYHSGFVKI